MTLLTIFNQRCNGIVAESAKKAVTLITFDVDGTLVQGSSNAAMASAHARAFCHAVGKVYGGIDNWELKVQSPPKVIPPERYHGSTDGLIALNLARYGFNIDTKTAAHQLPKVFQEMFHYVQALSDEEVAKGIDVLPGVINCFTQLASIARNTGSVKIGLVTGNVEGLARKKMRAVGLIRTGAFTAAARDQQQWPSLENEAILGGFGSDFCSNDIDDQSRLYKDRGQQILIAIRRAKSCLGDNERLVRVVHVGDAPADVLAAKCCSMDAELEGIEMGMIAVCTGKFTMSELSALVGDRSPRWDPEVLEDGMHDPKFIAYCKIKQ